MDLTAKGLLNASKYSTDGGYSSMYSLTLGWQNGYVETTGYIIPTALDLAQHLDMPALRSDAFKNGEWLLQHQLPCGAFPGIDRTNAEMFDTGQVLIGLQRLFAETKEEKYLSAGDRAAAWLCRQFKISRKQCQSEHVQIKTYLTRSASALIDFGVNHQNDDYVSVGSDFLDWVSGQILPSGLYKNSQLGNDDDYLLHTIVYVLEGFLHAHAVLGNQRWLDAAKRGAQPLKSINTQREIILYAYYDAELRARTSEKCLTGLAQWAGVCFRLFELTGDEDYRDCASNSLYYLKSKQMQSTGHLEGGLPGSVPFWGRYHRWSFPNWNLKFFGDALLKWQSLGLDDKKMQEIFVERSMAISSKSVGWAETADKMVEFDFRVLRKIEEIFFKLNCSPSRSVSILDLGCGEGRFIREFGRRRPDWKVVGIDPLVPKHSDPSISIGTATSIPFPENSLDGVYAIIALQHVDDFEACLSEVRRVLRPGGIFILFDRNPMSLRGLLKPWHEVRGRWLYSWDAPFRERWLTLGAWKKLFRCHGFAEVDGKTMTHWSGKGLRGKLPVNRFVFVTGKKQVIRSPERHQTP